MIEANIQLLLLVTGAATASMLGQFIAPRSMLRAFNGLSIDDPVSIFFARAAGLAIGSIGILILWAATDPALRVPVLSVALAGKALFISAIASRWGDFGRGFLVVAIFDSFCVLAYAGFLLGY